MQCLLNVAPLSEPCLLYCVWLLCAELECNSKLGAYREQKKEEKPCCQSHKHLAALQLYSSKKETLAAFAQEQKDAKWCAGTVFPKHLCASWWSEREDWPNKETPWSGNTLKSTWEAVNDPEVLLSQRTTFTKWGFLQEHSLFAKLLPLRRDACKCQCARRARLPAAGRTYCRRRVKPGRPVYFTPPAS